MKIEIKTEYIYVDDDGSVRVSNRPALDKRYGYGAPNWPDVEAVYSVQTDLRFICDCESVELAQIIARYFRTKGGQAQLEAYEAVQTLQRN